MFVRMSRLRMCKYRTINVYNAMKAAGMARSLLEPRAERNLFKKAGEHWRATFERGCKQHAVRFEATHLAWSEVGDDDDLSADELFRLVILCDAGQDLALFIAEVDFKTEELVGLGHALGNQDPGDAKVDLGEVVDGDEFVLRRSGVLLRDKRSAGRCSRGRSAQAAACLICRDCVHMRRGLGLARVMGR